MSTKIQSPRWSTSVYLHATIRGNDICTTTAMGYIVNPSSTLTQQSHYAMQLKPKNYTSNSQQNVHKDFFRSNTFYRVQTSVLTALWISTASTCRLQILRYEADISRVDSELQSDENLPRGDLRLERPDFPGERGGGVIEGV